MLTDNPQQGFLEPASGISWAASAKRLVALSILSGLLFSATTLVVRPCWCAGDLIQWITEGGGSTSGLLAMTAVLGWCAA